MKSDHKTAFILTETQGLRLLYALNYFIQEIGRKPDQSAQSAVKEMATLKQNLVDQYMEFHHLEKSGESMYALDYQNYAAKTMVNKPVEPLTDEEAMLVWNALGLAGESGEVADLIKKVAFHRHTLDREEVIKELGDVLWYAAAIATTLGISLDGIMHTNLSKLKERYPEGFTVEDSHHD